MASKRITFPILSGVCFYGERRSGLANICSHPGTKVLGCCSRDRCPLLNPVPNPDEFFHYDADRRRVKIGNVYEIPSRWPDWVRETRTVSRLTPCYVVFDNGQRLLAKNLRNRISK